MREKDEEEEGHCTCRIYSSGAPVAKKRLRAEVAVAVAVVASFEGAIEQRDCAIWCLFGLSPTADHSPSPTPPIHAPKALLKSKIARLRLQHCFWHSFRYLSSPSPRPYPRPRSIDDILRVPEWPIGFSTQTLLARDIALESRHSAHRTGLMNAHCTGRCPRPNSCARPTARHC